MWLYVILGIAIYYAIGIIFGLLLGIIDVFFELNINYNNLGFQYLGIPVGVAGCYVFHVLLKKKWKKESIIIQDEIEDIGKSFNKLNENN